MALVVTSGAVPKNAIPLSPTEAVKYQWEQIAQWPNQLDVWPFKWGIGGLAVLSAAAGAKINNMYRRKVKLRHHGFLVSNLPLTVTPAIFTAVLHAQFVTHKLFLEESNCPLCLQGKAALVQAGFTTVYPIILSPVANFMLAWQYTTYRVPYYTDVRETLNLWWKFTKPMGTTLLVVALVQGLAASVITYYEAKHLYNLRAKLIRYEETRNSA